MEITTKSPLLEEKVIQIDPPKYSETEEIYLKGLRSRMELARNSRDTQHEEFDGMDYSTYYNTNERLANTFIEPKRNKEDNNFQSGTIRTKLFAVLSSVVNLDLSGDISAYDRNLFKIQSLGDAMEDVILKTNELDGDDEKKLMRQYELLKQGTIFVEEVWDERSKKEKRVGGKFTGKLTGTSSLKWETRIKKVFARPTRNIIPGINVYLGDLTKYNSCDQPFLFSVDSMPYSEAELIFGEWDRWKDVPKDLVSFENTQERDLINWRLLEQQRKGHVEIVRYQDKWNNEFAVLINGVLMTPVGLPLPWGYEDYNLVQQNLEPIHAKFAYGKSLVFRVRNKVAILDEMMKLGVLKTQKSFVPPKFNLTGRVLSSRIFMPAKMTHGVDPRMILNADDKEVQGVTQAELTMMEKVQESIDNETTSPTFQGIQARGTPTATETIEMQRQAKQMLGPVIFSISMLEWKLEWLRLQNLLVNWFNPQDTVVDEMRNELRSQYRAISVQRPIEGEGMGQRMVIPTDNMPSSPEAVMEAERVLTAEQGTPTRLIFVNPEEVKSSKICWQIVIRPREKRTSEADKLLFRAFIADAMPLNPNIEELQQEFASVWGKNPQKLFAPNPAFPTASGEGSLEGGAASPKVNLPQPAKMASRQMSQGIKTGV